jgi:surface protein
MNKSQYQRRVERLNPGIRQEEVERKWRKFLKEKEEMERYQMVSEAENTPAVLASVAGGGKIEGFVPISTDFISTWRTTSSEESITLPLISAGTYEFEVYWGDGTSDVITLYSQPEITHTYEAAGDYTVALRGEIEGFNFNDVPASRLKIREITQWGNLKFVDGGSYFKSCSNLGLTNVTDVLDLTGLADLSYMFYECSRLTTVGRMNEWDVSSATDMSYMFTLALEFNQSLLFWDVSNVQSMSRMFATAGKFDQPLSLWDTSSVTDMSYMFFSANLFNRPINSWNVGNVQNMSAMFLGAASFNQSLGLWNTVNVTNMTAMFGSSAFNQPIGVWDVGNVQSMSNMFQQNFVFNQSLNSWNTASVTDMSSMFQDATAFDQPLNSWLTGNVSLMLNMFNNATAFNRDISYWNIQSINPPVGLGGFMSGKTSADYSATNYDNLLIGWSSQLALPFDVIADFGTIQYTSAGATARDFLTIDARWIITDGGIV